MKTKWKKLALGLVGAGMLTLYGCGGGGSSATIDAPKDIVVATEDMPVTVIDGPIQNATVCLDKNANGLCDAGEPTGKTNAKGKTTLKVDKADVGKFAVLAVVGTDAIDSDRPNTPITTPFTMKAPADQPAVVSPLTTLVHSMVSSTGISSTAAEAQLKEQTGLKVSLFEDFTKNPTADKESAGTLARMLVVTTQQKSDTIKSTVGTKAIDGTTIKQSDIDKLVQARLIEILSNVLAALADPKVAAAATPAAKEAAIQEQTKALLAVPSNATGTTTVAALVGISNLSTAPAVTTTAAVSPAESFVNLRAMTFTDASNWFVRTFSGTAQQNTADSAGNVKFVERIASSVAGEVANWGTGKEPKRQADLSFNGTAWVNCPINFENTSTLRDAKGNNTYSNCNGRETGTSNRAQFDISGKTMASVYQQIRDAGYTNITIANTAVLGSATFGAGAKLQYHTGTPLTSANTYYPGTGNIVKQYSADVSAGGVGKTQAAGVGCNSTEAKNPAGPSNAPETLEALVKAASGTPCVFTGESFVNDSTTFTNPDTSNEWWDNSTITVGQIGNAAVGRGVAPGYYTSNSILKVAFTGTGTNPVTYYSCKQHFNNGSSRNCSAIGTGSYTITAQGDARALSFNNVPSVAAQLGYQRVLVERGGKVFYGYKNNLTVNTSARLNTVAAAALFTQLDLPAVNPDVPLALSRASYQGVWDISSVESPLQKTVLTISNTGTTSCQNTDARGTMPVVTTEACVIVFDNLATGAFTGSTPGSPGSSNITLNFLTGTLTGKFVGTAGNATLVGARR